LVPNAHGGGLHFVARDDTEPDLDDQADELGDDTRGLDDADILVEVKAGRSRGLALIDDQRLPYAAVFPIRACRVERSRPPEVR
jgi:hypothetical protein